MTETKLSEILEESFVRCRDLEAPLGVRLQAFTNELRRLGPRFAAALDALVGRLAESHAVATSTRWLALRRRSLLSTATLPRSCPIDKSSRCGSDPKPRRRFQFSRI